MSKEFDPGLRDARVVFMMSASELDALDTWRHAKRIGSRAKAIRALVVAGIHRAETVSQLSGRLAQMPALDAAREACGNPLVARIVNDPVAIQFTDGTELNFEVSP